MGEFERLVDVYEDLIYDDVLPALTGLTTPEERSAFFETVDWNALRDSSPKLWSRYSKQALDTAERQLRRFDAEQRRQDRDFRPQVIERPMFGLAAGEQKTAGLTTKNIPLGGI